LPVGGAGRLVCLTAFTELQRVFRSGRLLVPVGPLLRACAYRPDGSLIQSRSASLDLPSECGTAKTSNSDPPSRTWDVINHFGMGRRQADAEKGPAIKLIKLRPAPACPCWVPQMSRPKRMHRVCWLFRPLTVKIEASARLSLPKRPWRSPLGRLRRKAEAFCTALEAATVGPAFAWFSANYAWR